jgi:hypothetical protein
MYLDTLQQEFEGEGAFIKRIIPYIRKYPEIQKVFKIGIVIKPCT